MAPKQTKQCSASKSELRDGITYKEFIRRMGVAELTYFPQRCARMRPIRPGILYVVRHVPTESYFLRSKGGGYRLRRVLSATHAPELFVSKAVAEDVITSWLKNYKPHHKGPRNREDMQIVEVTIQEIVA